MYRELWDAFIGKVQWERLYRKICVDRYLLMPHENEEYNDYTLRYLPAYLEKERASSVCVVTCDKQIHVRMQETVWPEKYKVMPILKSEAWLRRIIQFYALYEFSSQVRIISLTKPYDTCGENLLGVHGITKRELCCYDILGFSELPEEGSQL